MSSIKDVFDRLRAITDGCRPDMHEPDEQRIKCRVVGDHLDNAFGAHIDVKMIEGGFQEFVVVLERFMGGKIEIERFNLADLIALARRNATANVMRQRDDLLAAGERVLAHLNARIDQAPGSAKPVFDGIVELHDAIAAARDGAS